MGVHSPDRIAMSQMERDVLKNMQPALDGKRTQAEAGRLLELSERQIRHHRRKPARPDGTRQGGTSTYDRPPQPLRPCREFAKQKSRC